MTDISELLAETAANPPCGEDLTYDPDFLALETAARGKLEQQYGSTVIPAEEPDWQEVERHALALMKRTKDVRVAGLLCRAWTNMRGMRGMASGIELMAELMSRYWDQVHPLPEESDYFMRMNAVAVLDDKAGLIRELRQSDFLKASFGTISVRDTESLARGQSAEGHAQLSPDQLRVGMAEAWAREDANLKSVGRSYDALMVISALCKDKLPGDQQPELTILKSLLQLLKTLLPKDTVASDAASDEAGDEGGVDGDGVAAGPGHRGALRTRDDAIAQLLNVAEFLERTEPTNPAPLLIRRAARLMRMGFMDILRELTPDSLSHVETITGPQTDS